MNKLRPAQFGHSVALNSCLSYLKSALTQAKIANCPALCMKIRSAIKSAGGAQRHMERRLTHSQ